MIPVYCAALCCAALCCAVLCCAVLCCAVLRCAALCCAVLDCVELSRQEQRSLELSASCLEVTCTPCRRGSKQQCLEAAREAVLAGHCCVIDRCHQDAQQRSAFVQLAAQLNCPVSSSPFTAFFSSQPLHAKSSATLTPSPILPDVPSLTSHPPLGSRSSVNMLGSIHHSHAWKLHGFRACVYLGLACLSYQSSPQLLHVLNTRQHLCRKHKTAKMAKSVRRR